MTGDQDLQPRRKRHFFGRATEVETLMDLFRSDGPEIIELTGVPGVGKTSLIQAFSRVARDDDKRVDIFDCRTLEPTATSFEKALRALWADRPGSGWRVICLDHYDHFLLLDAWLGSRMESFLDQGLRFILVGRSIPGPLWSSPGLRVRSLKLDGLDPGAAAELLSEARVEGEQAERIQHFTKGHPLALELAISWPPEQPNSDLEALPSPELVHRLTRLFLDQVKDPSMREALEASSAVRRVTRPMLDEMLANDSGQSSYEELSTLPLIEMRSDGLCLHPTVHETIASWLRTSDPSRFTEYRRRAWKALERRNQSIATGDYWRYTADVIYLIDDPIVRGAFFPTSFQSYAVEPARPEDHSAIIEITQVHDGPEEGKLISHWLTVDPDAFHVVRDKHSAIQGYYCLISSKQQSEGALQRDPMTRAWHADFTESKSSSQQKALYIRRWLSRTWGDAPSPIQAACWLDIKRAYLEGRPQLRRVYLAVKDLSSYAEAAKKLGFMPICNDQDLALSSAMLDFGPGSVDGWLGRLVQQSLGILDSVQLDVEQHALSLGARSVPLTPRELDVVRILLASSGEIVSRERLFKEAWDGGYSVGSNVIDVLIRGLRKKLGDRADLIETVRGAGYRWSG